MQSAFIINDRSGKPYALVGLLNGGTEFYPITENARSWSGWMKDEFAAKKISREELIATLDNSMQVQGPMAVNRTNRVKIDELLKKVKKPAQVVAIEAAKVTEEKTLLPVISLMDAHIGDLEDYDWRNTINFKAKSFIADSNKSTFAYEVKRTRATWDASLAIPGTDRRGGWRCPVGTRYGGQITDRFGRNCGWGVARRLANEISDLGERLENVGDRRMARRVERRNTRMVRRLQQGGRIERAARGVANALETDGTPRSRAIEAPKEPRGAGIVERAAGRIGRALETGQPRNRQRNRRGPNAGQRNRDDQGIVERLADRVAEALESDNDNVPSRRPAPQRRPAAPRAPQARPARPRQPRQPRPAPNNRPNAQRPQVDNVSKTPVPAGAPNPGESLEAYKRRKYNEHQANVRQIREQGGNAGFLRYDEWQQFHGPLVEQNWRRANPDADQPQAPAAPAPQRRPRAPRQPAGRGSRRVATDANAGRAATRRPTANDAPEANQPPQRVRRPFNAPGQRGVGNLNSAMGKREQMMRDNPNKDYIIAQQNGKYFVVDKDEISKIERANAEGAQIEIFEFVTPNAPNTPTPAPSPRTPANRPPVNRPPAATPLNRIRDRHDEKMPRLDDGNGGVVRVPVGNAGINTKEDAKAYSGSLKDVPDDFLIDALMSRSVGRTDLPARVGANETIMDRIKRARTNPQELTDEDKQRLKELRESGKDFVAIPGASITAPMFFLRIAEDGNIDGRGYIAKNEDPQFKAGGNHAELIGIELSRRMGFAAGSPRIINRPGQQVLVAELAPNFADGHVVSSGIPNADKESRLGHFLVNLVLNAGDRHGRNGMHFVGNGALPIDFGRAFRRGDNTPDQMVRYLGSIGELDNNPIQQYQSKQELKEQLTKFKQSMMTMIDDGAYDLLTREIRGNSGFVQNGRGIERTARKQWLTQRINLIDSDDFVDRLWTARP